MTVDLGQQIRMLRKDRGWSAQRLSNEIGGIASRSVIADIETGRRKDLSLAAGTAIAKAFGLTAEQLMDEQLTAHIRRNDIETRLAEIKAEIRILEDELNSLAKNAPRQP